VSCDLNGGRAAVRQWRAPTGASWSGSVPRSPREAHSLPFFSGLFLSLALLPRSNDEWSRDSSAFGYGARRRPTTTLSLSSTLAADQADATAVGTRTTLT
jgi:hypothetical protein